MPQKGKHGHGGRGKGHGHGHGPAKSDKPIGMVKQRSLLAERLVFLVIAIMLIGLGIFLYAQFFS